MDNTNDKNNNPVIEERKLQEEIELIKAEMIKVLVVEDTRHMQELITYIFKHHCQECDLTIADTGELALEMTQASKYDIIFMDIGLPELDGINTTKAIRSSEGLNKATPIIAFTAHSHMQSECLKAGMNAFLDKVSPTLKIDIKHMIARFAYELKVPTIA